MKHKDSRRPSSWREDNITRTEDEARALVQGNDSDELVTENSDLSSFVINFPFRLVPNRTPDSL